MALTSNITSNKELKDTMGETLQFLSDTLRHSLGPYGSTTIIQDQYMHHQITKDGYSLLKKIYIEEDEPATILDFVKVISRTLVRKVGDGSTSSIIIANSLYKELTKTMEKYKIPPKDLLDVLNTLSKLITTDIKGMAKPIDDDLEMLKHIAAVSTNNDLDYGSLITEIFRVVGKYGFIDLRKSKTEKTYYEITNGFEFKRGYILPIMANQPDRKTCIYEDCHVLVVNAFLGESDQELVGDIIGRVCYGRKQPLLIIAKGYDTYFTTFMQANMKNPNVSETLKCVAVDLAMEGKENQDRLDDICISLGATLWDKANGETFLPGEFDLNRLGKCNRVVVTEKFCRLIEGQGDKQEIDYRIKMLTEEREEKSRNEGHIELDEDVYILNKRISALQSSLAVLYVGGVTEDAKDTDKYLIEDAVFACRSALQFGYIVGGNLIVPLVISEHKDEILENLWNTHRRMKKEFLEEVLVGVSRAFLDSYVTVLNNCYLDENYSREVANSCIENKTFLNLKEDRMETMEETRIINSAETDIEILKSAISIIGLLATSNQFIRMNTRRLHSSYNGD